MLPLESLFPVSFLTLKLEEINISSASVKESTSIGIFIKYCVKPNYNLLSAACQTQDVLLRNWQAEAKWSWKCRESGCKYSSSSNYRTKRRASDDIWEMMKDKDNRLPAYRPLRFYSVSFAGLKVTNFYPAMSLTYFPLLQKNLVPRLYILFLSASSNVLHLTGIDRTPTHKLCIWSPQIESTRSSG